jgi:hypothetical protein
MAKQQPILITKSMFLALPKAERRRWKDGYAVLVKKADGSRSWQRVAWKQ